MLEPNTQKRGENGMKTIHLLPETKYILTAYWNCDITYYYYYDYYYSNNNSNNRPMLLMISLFIYLFCCHSQFVTNLICVTESTTKNKY